MEVNKTVEHEDGSATIWFDLTEEEKNELIQLGILTAIKRGIEAEKAEFDFTNIGETE